MQPVHPDDTNWREWLLASLHDSGVQTPPRHTFSGVVLPLLGMMAIVAAGYVVGAIAKEAKGGIVVMLLWLVFSIFVLSRVYNRFLRRTWQTRARSAEEELRRAGSRRPILYLRSFALDAQVGRPGWSEKMLGTIPFNNAEQRLTHGLGGLGPVIAIGRPGEQLPALGAARFYVSHDRWQQKVADVVQVSQLVVWATGVTEGLRWEISHLIDSLPPEKLILWAHPHLLPLSEAEREAEWTRFRALLGNLFPRPLPERLGETRFIHFAANHQPLPVGPRGMGKAQDTALLQLLRAKGLPSMDWGGFLLGFQGRINRAKYWLGTAWSMLLLFLWGLIVGSLERSMEVGTRGPLYTLAFAALFVLLVPAAAIAVKRLHDRAKSGLWLLLLYLAPALLVFFGLGWGWAGIGAGQTVAIAVVMALSVWMLVELGVLAGTVGRNKYGPDPKGTRIMGGFSWPW
ncbi:MAG TPA: DUF805 domain-containing protein [Bryobacteraceae bacterium]|nr:DUF805 domain-containing protein [Bryobacteraceae bacterium]